MTAHAWILRRVALGVLLLFVVSLLVFVASQLLPGDPARAILGPSASAEQVQQLTVRLGLDRPVVTQYLDWLGGLLTGDMGESLASRTPVSELLGTRLVNSAALVLVAGLVTIPLSIVVGALAAFWRDSPFDRAFLVVSLVGVAVPEFVVGIVLVIVFSTTVLTVLPAVSLIPPGASPFADPALLVLPVATLAIGALPYLGRLTRGSMLEVLDAEYVQMARLKGMPTRRVIWRHALPNAIVPALQGAALALAYMTAGVVVIESVFNYPGLGTALTGAVQNRDLPIIQAVVMLFAVAYIVFNLVADVLTVYLTPRLRPQPR